MTEDDYKYILRVAQERILQQAALLEQLTELPLVLATVVTAGDTKVHTNELTVGGEVKIFSPGNAYHDQTAKVLRIDNGGYIYVRLSDEDEDYFGPEGYEVLPVTVQSCVVALEGRIFEVPAPADLNIQPGDTVRLTAETMQIIDLAEVSLPGTIAIVRRPLEGMSEVDYQGSVTMVVNGRFAELEKGDRVVLDSSGSVITQNLGKDDERFSFTAETNVSWNDIGGLADAKAQMIEAIEMPHLYSDLYAHYNKKPIKGVLLYGPPGCGKTMLGKATASSLAKIYGGDMAASGFIYVKGPEILEKFVGAAEATIRQLFQHSREHKEAHGYPAVIFIDEADAILGKRGMGISSDIERTIVPMFLTEMDGLEDSGAVVILATNRPDVLDDAVTRDGRIDRKIKIGRPTVESAAEIFELYLKNVPFYNGCTVPELAEVGRDELFSPERVLYTIALKGDASLNFTLGQICNGGMIAGIVDQATSIAMHRDIAAKRVTKPEGLRRDDLVQAVEDVYRQNFDLNHNDDLADFVHDFRDDVTGVRRLSQATA